VRAALGAMERTFEQAAGFEPTSTERHFRIGLREALEPRVLPELSQAICAAGPHLSLASARHDRPRLEMDLAAGEFDVALDVLLPVADRVPHERVLTDRLVVIARKDHPRLRKMKRTGWTLDAYLEFEHVQVSSRRRGLSLEDVALQSRGRTRCIRLRCQSHAAACRAAASTDLVVTLPETYARHVLERATTQVVALPLEGITLETYMYWPANAASDAANRWLRDQVRNALRDRH
jgi:DNA-binding transcriptional LysR family regulator